MTPAGTASGKILKGLLLMLAGALIFALLLAWGLVWYVNKNVSVGIERYLRKTVFNRPETLNFQSLSIDLLRGRFALAQFRMKGRSETSDWIGSAKEISASASIQELLSGEGEIRRVAVAAPSFEWTFGLEPRQLPPSPLPAMPESAPLRTIDWEGGQIVLVNKQGQAPLKIANIDGELTGPLQPPLRLKADARIASPKAGKIKLVLEAKRLKSPMSFQGELKINDLSVVHLAKTLLPNDPEIQVLGGTIDLKTQLACEKDWLTASHLVEIKNLKIQVADSRTKILGMKVKYIKDVLDIDYLSFVIPMNGSINDPQIGVSSSLQQIVYKLTEGKMEDRDDQEAFAKKAGDYLGAKVDKALRDWLEK